jgi:putative ABC transport system permease protein
LVAQVVTETSLLAVAGGSLGLVIGWLGFRSVLSLLPDVIPSWVEFSFDARLVLFVVGVTAATALLSALLPAIQLSKGDLQALLTGTGPRTSLSGRSRRAKDLLVIAEVFLALVLVAACGLVLKAFVRVTHTDPGFRTEDLVTFALDPPYGWPGPLDNVKLINFYDELLGRLRAGPGVESAAMASDLPFGTGRGISSLQWIGYYQPEGSPRPASNEYQQVFNRVILPGYFSTMGVPLRRGRDFDTRDASSREVSVIVNEAFVRHFWRPGTDVLGKRVQYLGPPAKWATVIGVIGDVHYAGLDQEIFPEAYLPYHQFPFPQMFVAVRGRVGPQALLAASAGIVRELDPSLALYDVSTMQDREYRSLWARHTYSWLFGALAGIALLLAVVGIYGATSYSVEQRVREIAIRIALGADTSRILYDVVREGMMLVALGISSGLLVVFVGTRFLRSFLAGVSPNDPGVLLIAIVLLASAAFLANFVPAWRAARTSVGVALRQP